MQLLNQRRLGSEDVGGMFNRKTYSEVSKVETVKYRILGTGGLMVIRIVTYAISHLALVEEKELLINLNLWIPNIGQLILCFTRTNISKYVC
jgi:hypothetical protein